MKKHYSEIKPHEEDFLYRRLAAVCPVTQNGRNMDIALQCDGDTQSVTSVAYGYGPVIGKWDTPELSDGRVKIPRS